MSYQVITVKEDSKTKELSAIKFGKNVEYIAVVNEYNLQAKNCVHCAVQQNSINDVIYTVQIVRYQEEWNEQTADVIREVIINSNVYSV